MASAISFQGLATNLPTDQLVNAIIQQESGPLQRLQAIQAANTKRRTALTSIRTSLSSLAASLASLSTSGFQARSITSSDSNNTYVSASASGGASGAYDVAVKQLATRARYASSVTFTSPTGSGGNLGGTAVSGGEHDGQYHYAITDVNGSTTKDIYLSADNNTLAGLRDAINGADAGVSATIIQTSAAGNAYQLVVTADDEGSGVTGTDFKIIGNGSDAGIDKLGIGSVGTSTISGQNAIFSVNGLELTRATNSVSDAVEGVTFTLRQADSTYDDGTHTSSHLTTLTVATDKSAITASIQDVITKFNAAYKAYKDQSGQGGVLANDSTLRSIFSKLRSTLTLQPDSMPSGSTYKSAAEVGLKTNRDGTLSLDATAFQSALDNDPEAVSKVFGMWGSSTNANVSYVYATSASTTSPISYDLTYSGGAVSGTLTANGVTKSVSGSNGLVTGPDGSPFEGLTLSVTGTASGTFSLVRGAGQLIQDYVGQLTASTSGNLALILQSIDDQNLHLSKQITDAQARLDRHREILQTQFANLEATIGQLQAAGQSLSGLR